jgi:hypothetical protein
MSNAHVLLHVTVIMMIYVHHVQLITFNVNYKTQWDAVFAFLFVFYFYTHTPTYIRMYVHTEGPKNVRIYSKLNRNIMYMVCPKRNQTC